MENKMNEKAEHRLTEEEILSYIKPENRSTGVDAITREMLESIDLREVRDVVREGDRLLTPEGRRIFKLDRFVPRLRSNYFKPAFAGSQLLLGKEERKLYFSDGVWFASSL